MQISGPALVVYANGGDEVEAQESEVDEIVARQGFVAQMGMHEAQPTKAAVASTQATNLGKNDT